MSDENVMKDDMHIKRTYFKKKQNRILKDYYRKVINNKRKSNMLKLRNIFIQKQKIFVTVRDDI